MIETEVPIRAANDHIRRAFRHSYPFDAYYRNTMKH